MVAEVGMIIETNEGIGEILGWTKEYVVLKRDDSEGTEFLICIEEDDCRYPLNREEIKFDDYVLIYYGGNRVEGNVELITNQFVIIGFFGGHNNEYEKECFANLDEIQIYKPIVFEGVSR